MKTVRIAVPKPFAQLLTRVQKTKKFKTSHEAADYVEHVFTARWNATTKYAKTHPRKKAARRPAKKTAKKLRRAA